MWSVLHVPVPMNSFIRTRYKQGTSVNQSAKANGSKRIEHAPRIKSITLRNCLAGLEELASKFIGKEEQLFKAVHWNTK